MPLLKPPYGSVSAINLNDGTIAWQIAHGETPDAIKNHPLLKGLNIPRTGQTGMVGPICTKTLVICGDEDDACIQPSIFLKQHIPTSGLSMFPKTGHILNLEEPALFNETLERFLVLAESGRWPARDPASKRK